MFSATCVVVTERQSMKEGKCEATRVTRHLVFSMLPLFSFQSTCWVRLRKQLAAHSQHLGPLCMCLLQGSQSGVYWNCVRSYTVSAWGFSVPGLPEDLIFPIKSSRAPWIWCKEGDEMLSGKVWPCRASLSSSGHESAESSSAPASSGPCLHQGQCTPPVLASGCHESWDSRGAVWNTFPLVEAGMCMWKHFIKLSNNILFLSPYDEQSLAVQALTYKIIDAGSLNALFLLH